MNRIRLLAAGGLLASATVLAAAEKAPAKPDVKKPAVIIAPPPPDVLAEAIRAEMEAYQRRIDSCTRLREIAIQTSNDSLLNEVDEIEKQALALYQARTARLGLKQGGQPKPGSDEPRVAGTVDPRKVGQPVPGRAAR
jgi:hypothetical protein